MKYWIVLKAVCTKSLIELRRYLFNTVSSLVTMYIVFVLLFFGAKALGGPTVQTGDTLEAIVVGYLVWVFSIMAYSDLAWNITSEAQIGTLEQLFLSPTGFAWVQTSLLVGRFLINVVFASVLLLVMMATSGYWLNVDLVSLVPLLLVTIAAPYGFGFLMGGLALIFKRIQASFQILQFVFFAFLAVPVGKYAAARFLPLVLGNSLIHRVMVDGARIWELPAGELTTAGVVGLVYLAAGVATFGYCVNVARNRGLLGQY